MDVAEYCRELETHLCRKNDGHLIRIAGPSFELVSRWAEQGVPLKVAKSGIDRYFERYYRKGPRRRPVKIDFCEADVLDMFDEWRRATGLSAAPTADTPSEDAAVTWRKGPSLPEHLERVLLRLSSLRATGALGESADPLVDAVSSALDTARTRSGGVRGDERQLLIERLVALDAELMAIVRDGASGDVLEEARRDAADALAPFRHTMEPAAFEQAFERLIVRALRERIGLPVIAFA
ncbi:MAG: hypothetical protein QM736_12970 [Vicinamibacterales bacterium]